MFVIKVFGILNVISDYLYMSEYIAEYILLGSIYIIIEHKTIYIGQKIPCRGQTFLLSGKTNTVL